MTPLSQFKSAASRLGIPIDTYLGLLGDGKKRCYRCREWKDKKTSFHKDRSSPGGFEELCKQCSKEKKAGLKVTKN